MRTKRVHLRGVVEVVSLRGPDRLSVALCFSLLTDKRVSVISAADANFTILMYGGALRHGVVLRMSTTPGTRSRTLANENSRGSRWIVRVHQARTLMSQMSSC